MKRLFLDANVVVRHLTQDVPEQGRRARDLLKRVETGELQVTILESAVAEIVYVLGSKRLYNLPRERIRDDVGGILALRGMKLTHKRACIVALELYAAHPHLSFVDALNAARAGREKDAAVVSFDKGFDRAGGARRQEP